MDDIFKILEQMSLISLEDMKSVKLMNRIDTKYVIDKPTFIQLLDRLKHQYFVQEIQGRVLMEYKTLYYDTPDLKMYTAHHNRILNRKKLRVRQYLISDDCYCEIKMKNNKGRTNKKRMRIAPERWDSIQLSPEIVLFIQKYLPYEITQLMPQLENKFKRITLVNKDKTERLTIDTGLSFYNHVTQLTASLETLFIVEVKQDGRSDSFFKNQLIDFRIRPNGFSKYCMGTVLTRSDVKYNRFKLKIRYLAKLLQDTTIKIAE